MNDLYYIGRDIHKKSISFVIKTDNGQLLRRPWVRALEATLFSGWVDDHLQPWARELKVAHAAMLQAIACAKKKNDRLDAEKICDLLRCDLLTLCYMAATPMRELRRILRYRNPRGGHFYCPLTLHRRRVDILVAH